MSTKAKLIIILKADNTVVSEVEDPILWQKVLSAIHSGSASDISHSKEQNKDIDTAQQQTKHRNGDALARLATHIGVTTEQLKGALDPSLDAPYLHLDRHCWEAMKRNTPGRGVGALSPTAVAGTLLALWFNEAGLGNPTQSQAMGVLKGIGIIDKNPSRGIKSTPWLQGRAGGVIVINPAQISKASSVARSFCTKTWASKEDN